MISINNNNSAKDLEDIKVVKKYFSRIFSVLSKEIREKLLKLDISEEKKKLIAKELAFLSKKKQKKYLDEFFSIYNQTLKKFKKIKYDD